MIEYFENYYIGKLKKNSMSIREEPIFKPKFWNVFDRIEADLPRTNNSLESWHKNFEKHPTVNGLIRTRLEQNYTDIIIDQLESGDCYEKKKKQLIKDNKIKFLCNNYKSEKILEFIKFSLEFI
ncbi:unnamed protein product [Brachionus calyciflorus]|uniref:Uncharacterized protein n=1 Tax=Brachionus calyciflorus TaxID=104777 RepID=A0A814KDV1_9BILA|nr:unnamed protein product [Brachionus calyciflorus]